MQQDIYFKNQCDQIEVITGKEWQWVLSNFSLPDLIRLQGALLFFDTM